MENIRAKKTTKFLELKQDRNSKEYLTFFLKYSPSDEDKSKKNKTEPKSAKKSKKTKTLKKEKDEDKKSSGLKGLLMKAFN